MSRVYVYLLDTYADWELGYIMSEIKSGQYFKKDAKPVSLFTVGATSNAIVTKGGLTVIPDLTVKDVVVDNSTVLLLPGGDTWADELHQPILKIAKEVIAKGGLVGAICGATVALAEVGLLDNCYHTSNDLQYLKMFSPSYKGEEYYQPLKAVSSDNVVTASSVGGLLFARLLLEKLDVFREDTLTSWYNFHESGEASHFYKLMQSLEK